MTKTNYYNKKSLGKSVTVFIFFKGYTANKKY